MKNNKIDKKTHKSNFFIIYVFLLKFYLNFTFDFLISIFSSQYFM